MGMPLDEAVRRLEAVGIQPAVTISRAPRRPDGVGVFRVVRVQNGGRELTVCAFIDVLKEEISDEISIIAQDLRNCAQEDEI